MRDRLIIVLFALMAFSLAHAQDAHVPGALLVKVKPEYRAMCSDEQIEHPVLQAAMEALGQTSVKKRFSFVQPFIPDRAPDPNAGPDRRVDISLIYEIRFDERWDVRKAAKQLQETGTLEYAEPWFIPTVINTPNDELVDSVYYLPIINAFDGWDIDTGGADVVIAIIDTGVDKDHPDLVEKLWVNEIEANGIAGEDDDGNGLVDDFQGWNFYDDNNDINETGFSHGTHVAGLAGASTNNAIGMAGAGWACTIMGIKAGDKLQLPYGYDGIVYAAERGADVINCSWGSFGPTQFSHDIVRYATYNLDALLIGGAGNDNRDNRFYPASYSEVLSVGSSDANDWKSDFSNYNYDIDLLAPGSLILSLKNDGYGYDSGTSMSAPIAAGVAGLIRHRYPDLTALQVREQLRVTADTSIFEIPQNAPYLNKLGTGRLDLARAVEAINSPALRVEYYEVSDGDDEVFVPGEIVTLGMEISNFLEPVQDIRVKLVSEDPRLTVLSDEWILGDLGTNERLNNLVNPFELEVQSVDSFDVEVAVKVIAYSTSSDYKMTKYVTFLINPSYVNVTVNNISTTVSKNGLVGFTDIFQSNGLGFQFENAGNFVYEMGLMIGYKDEVRERVVDRVRSAEIYDRDFWEDDIIVRKEPEGEEAYLAEGSFTDTSARLDEIGLLIRQQAMAYTDPGHENYVSMTYTIENRSGKALYDMSVGMFADWDIGNATKNKAATAYGKRLGYVYRTGNEQLTGGIQPLGEHEFVSFMIDNVDGGAGGINMYDEENFSSRRKYKSLTENRFEAGEAGETGEGNDVIQVAAMKGVDILNGESKTFVFAIHAGRDIETVLRSADSAYVRYFGQAPGEDVEGAFELSDPWPNPTQGELTLVLNKKRPDDLKVFLYNSTGLLVHEFNVGAIYAGINVIHLDMPSVASGMYFLETKSEGESDVRTILYSAP